MSTEDAEPATHAPERRLRTDVFVMVGSKVLILGFTMAASIVLARGLGPSDRGIFGVGQSLVLVLVQVGSFGLATANPYFAARDPRSLGGIVTNSLWFAACLGSLLVGTAIVLKALFPGAVQGLTWTELGVAAASIPPALAALFLQSVLLAEGRAVAYNAVEVAMSGWLVVALGVAALAFGLTVTSALAIMLSMYVGSTAIFLFLALRHRPALWRPDVALALRMTRYAFRIYLATLMAFLVIRLDMLLVNAYRGAADAGVYAVTAGLAEGLLVLPVAVGVNLFPRIARGADRDLTAGVFRSVSVLFAIVCLVTVPLARPAVDVLYGSQFAEAATLYYWLLPGVFSLGMLTILSHHFAGKGFPLEALLVWFVGLGVNIAINVAFLPSAGLYVAPLASSIAYALLLVLHIRLFAKEAGGYGHLRPRLREVVQFVRVALGRGPAPVP
jgi:O-antigen/teichoic acid export membrane protein